MALFDGGGIFVTQHARVNIYHSILSENIAKRNGGAVLLQINSKLMSSKNSIVKNNYALGNGGGICVKEESNLILSEANGVEIVSNKALKGGGIFFNAIEEILSNLHYTNFPSNNTAVHGPDLWAFDLNVKPIGIICPQFKYFKYRLGVPQKFHNATNLLEIMCPTCKNGKTAEENSFQCNFFFCCGNSHRHVVAETWPKFGSPRGG